MNGLLGGRIKALRNANGFTQEQMADQLGMSRQRYARIEHGTNNVTLEVLSQITKILDIQVGDITKVLDEVPAVEYRTGNKGTSTQMIFDMLDLFYANKHLYSKLHRDDV